MIKWKCLIFYGSGCNINQNKAKAQSIKTWTYKKTFYTYNLVID